MGPGGLMRADIRALQQTVRDLDVVSQDVAAVGLSLRSVPPPTDAAYGWHGAAEAMAAVLSGWSAELDLFHQAMDQMTAQMNATIDGLIYAEEQANMAGGTHGP